MTTLPQEGLHCSTLQLWVRNTAEMIPREIRKHQILVLLSSKGVLHHADMLIKCYTGIKCLQISPSHTIRVIQIRIYWEFKAEYLVSVLFFNVTISIWLPSSQTFQPEKVLAGKHRAGLWPEIYCKSRFNSLRIYSSTSSRWTWLEMNLSTACTCS